MTYDTKNPVPSTDPRDLDDNAQAFDRLMNSTANTEPDRFGVPRLTYKYVENAASALVSPNVAALAALNGQADRIPYFTGVGALSLAVLTTVGRTLLAASTQAAQRAALGLTIGGANGVATLGADGLLPPALLPALAVNDTFTVASESAMLALTAQRGDVAIRTDLGGAAYILTADAPGTLANWVAIQQNLGASLQALGSLTTGANLLPYFTGTGAASTTSLTAFGRSLIDDSSAANGRTTLGAAASGANSDITGLSAIVGTAFTTLTLTNSWTVLSGFRAVYRKYLGMLQIELAVTGGTNTDGTVLTTLPAGFRPTQQVAIPVATIPTANAMGGRLVLGTDGTLKIYGCTTQIICVATLGLE